MNPKTKALFVGGIVGGVLGFGVNSLWGATAVIIFIPAFVLIGVFIGETMSRLD